MMSICEKKNSAEVRLIHAEQISLYKCHRFEKSNRQFKQNILSHWESMGFPKLF